MRRGHELALEVLVNMQRVDEELKKVLLRGCPFGYWQGGFLLLALPRGLILGVQAHSDEAHLLDEALVLPGAARGGGGHDVGAALWAGCMARAADGDSRAARLGEGERREEGGIHGGRRGVVGRWIGEDVGIIAVMLPLYLT